MNSMKRQNERILKGAFPRSVGVPYLLEKSGDIAPDGMKRLSQSGNNTQLWMCLVVKVKSDAIKNNIA